MNSVAGFTRAQWRILLAFAVLTGLTWWKAPWPAEQAMHHSLTLVALVGLAWVQRRYRLPMPSFLLLLAFLAIHTVAARWIYSFVPYDDWAHSVAGVRLSDAFGWDRNHFDRLVHASYGLLLAPVLVRYLRDVLGWRARWCALAAVEIVLSTSAIYELFEWGIAVTLAPGAAEAYNGQQGDAWDGQKDMALALAGAIVGATIAALRRPPATHAARGGGVPALAGVPTRVARMVLRVTTRNATFQQWQALLTNRTKRQRAGEFVVQGVRPLTLAVEHGWPVRSLLYPDATPLSAWAQGMLDRVQAKQFAVAPDLLRELGGKDSGAAAGAGSGAGSGKDSGTAGGVPELLGVVGQRPDELARIPAGPDLFVVVFDRPTAPGNLGTVIRSADAFGATGVVVTGHAADPYDPKAVRASTGSLFAVPVVRVDSHREVVGWASEAGAQLLGADESGDVDLAGYDLTGPTVVVIGNETRGLSAGWRQACDRAVRIPMVGAASSLNAASAATVVLYEAIRQRRPLDR